MSEHPKALRLADALANLRRWHELTDDECDEAAAELRRLHTLCGEWEKKAATWLASPQAAQRLDGYRELAQRLNAAEAVNQELLEALKQIVNSADDHQAAILTHLLRQAHAAIERAEGQA